MINTFKLVRTETLDDSHCKLIDARFNIEYTKGRIWNINPTGVIAWFGGDGKMDTTVSHQQASVDVRSADKVEIEITLIERCLIDINIIFSHKRENISLTEAETLGMVKFIN